MTTFQKGGLLIAAVAAAVLACVLWAASEPSGGREGGAVRPSSDKPGPEVHEGSIAGPRTALEGAVQSGDVTDEASLTVALWVEGRPVLAPLQVRLQSSSEVSRGVQPANDGRAHFEEVLVGAALIVVTTGDEGAIARDEVLLRPGHNEVDVLLPPTRRVSVHIANAESAAGLDERAGLIQARREKVQVLAWEPPVLLDIGQSFDQELRGAAEEWEAKPCDEPGHSVCGLIRLGSDADALLVAAIGSWVIAFEKLPPFVERAVLSPAYRWTELYGGVLVGRLELNGLEDWDGNVPYGGITVLADESIREWPLQSLDEGGSFRVEGLPPGRLWLWIRFPGFERRIIPIDMPFGGLVDLGVIEVGHGRCIEGRVLDQDGNPVATTLRVDPLSFPAGHGSGFGDGETRAENGAQFVFCELPRGEVALALDDGRFAVNPMIVDVGVRSAKGVVMRAMIGVPVSWPSDAGDVRIWDNFGRKLYGKKGAREVRLLPGRYQYQMGSSSRLSLSIGAGDEAVVLN